MSTAVSPWRALGTDVTNSIAGEASTEPRRNTSFLDQDMILIPENKLLERVVIGGDTVNIDGHQENLFKNRLR